MWMWSVELCPPLNPTCPRVWTSSNHLARQLVATLKQLIYVAQEENHTIVLQLRFVTFFDEQYHHTPAPRLGVLLSKRTELKSFWSTLSTDTSPALRSLVLIPSCPELFAVLKLSKNRLDFVWADFWQVFCEDHG